MPQNKTKNLIDMIAFNPTRTGLWNGHQWLMKPTPVKTALIKKPEKIYQSKKMPKKLWVIMDARCLIEMPALST